jgi:proline-specific peptidase
MSETTGLIDFYYKGETYRTWYKIFGDLKSGKRPLVVLHGGPGISHEYVLPHAELFDTYGIPVVFYDQVGIGRSTHLRSKGPEFWTIEFFMDELNNVLTHLGISDNYDLLGHSWGGFLAATYAGRLPHEGLKHLILTNTGASMKLWAVGTNNLLEQFPEETREMLKKHERDGTTDSKEYQEGIQIFYSKHVCKLQPWPELLLQSFGAMTDDPTVYSTMYSLMVAISISWYNTHTAV